MRPTGNIEKFPYIEIPVSGKGTLTIIYYLIPVSDASQMSDNQQLAVFNNNAKLMGKVENLKFLSSENGRELKYSVPISEDSTCVRIFFSRNVKSNPMPKGGLAIRSITYEK